MRRDEIDDPEVLKEIADIRAAVEEELNLTEGVTWKEVLIPGNRYRFAVAFTIFLCQQFSGTNSIGYYAPQIFQTVGVSKTNSSLFATGVYGTVKVCATGLFLIIGIDKFGRRNSLLYGAAWMAITMWIIGGVLKDHPPTNVNGTYHSLLQIRGEQSLTQILYSCLTCIHCNGCHDLPLRHRLLRLLGTHPMGLRLRDLPHPSPLLRRRSRRRHAMAL